MLRVEMIMGRVGRERNKKVLARSMQSRPGKPTAPEVDVETLWNRVEELVAESPETSSDPAASPEAKPVTRKRLGRTRQRSRWRKRRIVLDLAGTLVAAFVFVKLFVGDLDRLILDGVAPEFVWLLDVRWLLVLVALALILTVLKFYRAAVVLTYIAAFPLVVLLWKVPKMVARRRHRPLMLAGATAFVVNITARSRHFIVALAAACVSAFMIHGGEAPWVVIGCGLMFVTLGWWITVNTIDLLRTTKFMRAQQQALDWVVGSHFLAKFLDVSLPNTIQIKSWTAKEATAYRDVVGYTVLAVRALRFWSASLEELRRRPVAILLSVVVSAGMYLHVLLAMTFVTYGIYLVAPTQFEVHGTVGFASFLYYVANALGETGAVAPVGGFAIAAKLATAAYLAATIGAGAFGSLAGYRSIREDAESLEASAEMNEVADQLEDEAELRHHMQFRDLEERLRETGWGLSSIARWLEHNSGHLSRLERRSRQRARR
jgi:hypothetical protein